MNISKYKVVVRLKDKSQKTHKIETKDKLDAMVMACEDSPEVKSYSVYRQGEFYYRRVK